VVYRRFWWDNKRKKDTLEDKGVDGRILAKQLLTIWKA
jgi:hypothetical protein